MFSGWILADWFLPSDLAAGKFRVYLRPILIPSGVVVDCARPPFESSLSSVLSSAVAVNGDLPKVSYLHLG